MVGSYRAFMDVGRGRSGVFCAELSSQWLNNPQSRGALPRWLQEIFGYSERDRYSIRVSDRGQTMNLRIAVLAKAGKLPAVDQLTVTLELEDGSTVPMPMPTPGALRVRVVDRCQERVRFGQRRLLCRSMASLAAFR